MKSAGGRLNLNTHTPLTQRNRSGMTMPPLRIVWEPIRKRAQTQLVREHSATVSQLAEPLWTDPGLKSGTSVGELISTLKKERKQSAGWEWMLEYSLNILPSEKNNNKQTNKQQQQQQQKTQQHQIEGRDCSLEEEFYKNTRTVRSTNDKKKN